MALFFGTSIAIVVALFLFLSVIPLLSFLCISRLKTIEVTCDTEKDNDAFYRIEEKA